MFAKLRAFFHTARVMRYESPVRHYTHLRYLRWQYIEAFSTHRRRDSNGDDDIARDIDDVRNGVLLESGLRRVLGKHLAFLKVRLFDLVLHMVGN
jgi:hypothetical protein